MNEFEFEKLLPDYIERNYMIYTFQLKLDSMKLSVLKTNPKNCILLDKYNCRYVSLNYGGSILAYACGKSIKDCLLNMIIKLWDKGIIKDVSLIGNTENWKNYIKLRLERDNEGEKFSLYRDYEL